MNFNIQKLALILLLVVSLGLRIVRFSYPGILSSKWGDGTRDYLVAHHILAFSERPLTGPFNLLFESGLRNSPLYYYILAIFLIPYDNFLALGYVNIVLQVIAIFLIYLITKTLFDKESALIAVLLFSFTPTILRQTEYIWQPNLMQPVALLALYLLIISYFKKNFQLLITSLFLFIVGCTFHNSAFSWFPLIIVLSFLILKLENKNFKYYLGIISTSFLSLIFLHLPVFVYFAKNGFSTPQYPNFTGYGDLLYLQSVSNYLGNLIYNLSQILSAFSINNLWFLFLALLVIIYTLLEKTQKRWFFLLGLLFSLEPILVSSLFNKNQLHYLTISLPIFVILISAAVWSVLKSTPKPVWILVIFLLFKTFSQDFSFLKFEKNHDFALIHQASLAIEKEAVRISSFQIISFANDQTTFRYPTLDTILLVPLEKDLNQKLTRVSDNSPFSIEQTQDDQYIFLNCFEFKQADFVRDCTKDFLTIYPNYVVLRSIYNYHPLSIYLAKRS